MRESSLDVWVKRVKAARDLNEKWESENRVRECYSYWRGSQLVEQFDETQRGAGGFGHSGSH
jgi:hypothetical protein